MNDRESIIAKVGFSGDIDIKISYRTIKWICINMCKT